MATNDESMTGKARDVARADAQRVDATSGDTGREIGEGVGGVGGALAGAAIGSLAGPVGTVFGGIAGLVGGWWAGREVVTEAEGYSGTEDVYRNQFMARPAGARGRFTSYEQVRPVYQLGYLAYRNPDYRGKSFDQIEPDLQRGWTPELQGQYGSWNDVRDYAREAYSSGGQQSGQAGEQTMTRSEEELVVGKRQVRAGEVDLRKTVETEHVKKTVPLMHEEIEVERHAVSGDASDRNIEIGEQDIRVQLSAEEAVVNKRVVAKEEVVVKKHAVEGAENVEADIRKERIDIDREGRGKDANEVDRNA